MVAIKTRMWMLKRLYAIRFGEGAAVLPKDISRIHLDFAYRINGGHQGPRKFWRRCFPPLKFHNPAVQMTVNRTTDQTAPAILSIFYGKLPSSSSPESISPSSSESSESSSTADESSDNPQSSSSSPSSSTSSSSTADPSPSTLPSTSTSKTPPENSNKEEQQQEQQQQPSNQAPVSTTASPITSSAHPTPTSARYAPTDHVVTIDMKHRTEADILEEFLRITKAELVRPTDEDELGRLELEAETERRRQLAEAASVIKAQRDAEKEALAQARAELK